MDIAADRGGTCDLYDYNPQAEKEVSAVQCEYCVNYVYDELGQYYTCLVNMDEDEMERFLADRNGGCPYYQSDDEYQVVKHQM